MADTAAPMRRRAGFTMIEVLVAILIMMLGLLGLAAIQVRAQQAELESYQRAQALILVHDMVDRINANRKAPLCYTFTTNTGTGSPYAGTGAGAAPVCGPYGTTATRAQADRDLSDWHNLLLGTAETLGGNAAGAMVGARGCVSVDTTVNPNVYQVSVAWQGMVDTVDPTSVDATLTCGKNQYGAETRRRIVSYRFSTACLNC